MAAELDKLVTAGTMRLLDLIVLTKRADGEIDALEVEDLDDAGACAGRRRSWRACSRKRTS